MSLKKSLGSKIILVALLVLIVGTLGVKLAVYPQVNGHLRAQAEFAALESSRHYAEEVKVSLNEAFHTSEVLASAIEGLRAAGMTDRKSIISLLRHTLMDDTNLIATYTAFEPNAFDGQDALYANAPGHDDSGRFVPYWSRNANGELMITPLADYDKAGAGDYYQIPLRTNKPAALDPYEYVVGTQRMLISSFTLPLHDEAGKPVGIAGVDVELDELSRIVSETKPMGTGLFGIMTGTGTWVAHPNAGWAGKTLAETDPSYEKHLDSVKALKEVVVIEHSSALDAEALRVILPFTVGSSDVVWAIGLSIPMSTVNDVMEALNKIDVYSTLALVVLLGLLLAFVTHRMLTTPLNRVVESVARIQSGDYKTDVPYQKRADEIGVLGRALSALRDNSAEAEEMRLKQAEMEREAAVQQKAALNSMADTFEEMVGGIVQTVVSAVGEVQSSARSLSVTAEETSSQATAVAAATTETSTNVQTVAAAAEELSSSISEISRQVTESILATNQAVEAVERTDGAVVALSDAARNIGEVVELIRGVAEQTNLLALNATIESARAGEAGKGFAVVAGEVKMLAGQTAQATDQISHKIADIRTATENAVQAIRSIQAAIGNVSQISSFIATAVVQQETATQEISGNVQQASQGVTEVSQNIVGVTEASGNVGAASTQMLNASMMLSEQAETLQVEVTRFIKTVRG